MVSGSVESNSVIAQTQADSLSIPLELNFDFGRVAVLIHIAKCFLKYAKNAKLGFGGQRFRYVLVNDVNLYRVFLCELFAIRMDILG